MKITDIKPNPDNPRYISKREFKHLKRSITQFKKMLELRPIIIDENNIILCGNMRYHAMKELGWDEIPDKYILKVTDLSEEQKKELIIKDNKKYGDWDGDLLSNWDIDLLIEWGINLPETRQSQLYSTEIVLPNYEPKDKKPPISKLYNTKKYNELVNIINDADIPENIRTFLLHAATRFIEFDYDKIADFYAHSDKPVQELMEKLALVVVDIDTAIENGWVEMTKRLLKLCGKATKK